MGELVGFDVVLLCCVREHEDEAARALRATLMAAPRAAAPPGPGARWVGREDLAGAAFQHHQQAMVAGVLDELAGLFPDHVPASLAIHAERRWMALTDFGPEVGWDAPATVREDLLATFARLQAFGRRGGRAGRRRAPAGGDVRRARGRRRPGHAGAR